MVKKKAKKATRRKRKVVSVQMVGGGKLVRRPPPTRRRKLLYSVYAIPRGELIDIRALHSDPYTSGHGIFKLMEGIASVYANGNADLYKEALALIFSSVIDHGEKEINQLMGVPATLDDETPVGEKVH